MTPSIQELQASGMQGLQTADMKPQQWSKAQEKRLGRQKRAQAHHVVANPSAKGGKKKRPGPRLRNALKAEEAAKKALHPTPKTLGENVGMDLSTAEEERPSNQSRKHGSEQVQEQSSMYASSQQAPMGCLGTAKEDQAKRPRHRQRKRSRTLATSSEAFQ